MVSLSRSTDPTSAAAEVADGKRRLSFRVSASFPRGLCGRDALTFQLQSSPDTLSPWLLSWQPTGRHTGVVTWDQLQEMQHQITRE